MPDSTASDAAPESAQADFPHSLRDLESMHYEVYLISTLVTISSWMHTADDEATVVGILRPNITSTLRVLSVARQDLNEQAAFCGRSAIVVTRAQVGLSLLDDSERLLSWLQRRLY